MKIEPGQICMKKIGEKSPTSYFFILEIEDIGGARKEHMTFQAFMVSDLPGMNGCIVRSDCEDPLLILCNEVPDEVKEKVKKYFEWLMNI